MQVYKLYIIGVQCPVDVNYYIEIVSWGCIMHLVYYIYNISNKNINIKINNHHDNNNIKNDIFTSRFLYSSTYR